MLGFPAALTLTDAASASSGLTEVRLKGALDRNFNVLGTIQTEGERVTWSAVRDGSSRVSFTLAARDARLTLTEDASGVWRAQYRSQLAWIVVGAAAFAYLWSHSILRAEGLGMSKGALFLVFLIPTLALGHLKAIHSLKIASGHKREELATILRKIKAVVEDASPPPANVELALDAGGDGERAERRAGRNSRSPSPGRGRPAH